MSGTALFKLTQQNSISGCPLRASLERQMVTEPTLLKIEPMLTVPCKLHSGISRA
jgi:hypothetical protein